MKHKKLLLACLLILALTPLLYAADPPMTRMVPVAFDSFPDVAEVWVDGKFIGSTHLSYRLTPGEHKIELVRPRFATWTRTLTVNADQPTRVAALLQETNDKPCQ